MNVRRVPVTTAADGSFSTIVRCPGEILGVALVIGDLSTPDVSITDTLTGVTIFAKTGIGATASYRPNALQQTTAGVDVAAAAGPPVINNVYGPRVCYGQATVAVAGGGDTKSGDIYIAFRG